MYHLSIHTHIHEGGRQEFCIAVGIFFMQQMRNTVTKTSLLRNFEHIIFMVLINDSTTSKQKTYHELV